MSKPYIEIINRDDPNRWNCVKFAREKVPNLPYGQWTINDKKKICNTTEAKEGYIAIMNVGLPWGHLGFVKYVGKRHITIEEANYKAGKITKRHDTTANLMIIGYFKP